MSSPQRHVIGGFDIGGARQALLRYQPASNWVSVSRDPAQRMTIGYGFDLSRAEASEMLKQVGLDPAAVRSGRMPVSDAQMNELFDLTLLAAAGSAGQRIPGFAGMPPEQQWALLELMVWWGPDGSDAVFSELEALSLPLTDEPLEPSPWFDVLPEARTDVVEPPVAAGPIADQPAEPQRPRPRKPSVPGSTAPGGITFESFGLVAELVSDDPDLLHAAQAMLPPGWTGADGQPSVQFGLWRDGLITLDDTTVDWTPDRAASLLRLGAIVRHHLATEASAFTFVHAGVVDVRGCGIVIPGRSYTGKSTLVAELVRLGATYVSDEYAVLDPSGVVQPFAKPLSIRTGRHDRLGQLVPVPQARIADDAVRAGLIVLTSYAPGARWRPSVHSCAEGALALLQNTVSARLRPASALSATSQLARTAVVLAGRRGEASETAPALLEAGLRQAEGWATFPA
jgi:hypothetical protein